MDEAATNTGTENQTPHIPTHNWELNNENTWTQRGKHLTLGWLKQSTQATKSMINGTVPHISILTFNVNYLNAALKRCKTIEWIRTHQPSAAFRRLA